MLRRPFYLVPKYCFTERQTLNVPLSFSIRAHLNYDLSLFVVKNLCYIFMLMHSLYPGMVYVLTGKPCGHLVVYPGARMNEHNVRFLQIFLSFFCGKWQNMIYFEFPAHFLKVNSWIIIVNKVKIGVKFKLILNFAGFCKGWYLKFFINKVKIGG